VGYHIIFLVLFVVSELLFNFAASKSKNNIMTAAARTIQASPMAPILDMVKGVDVDVMHAVVEYMNEAIREAEEAKRKAEDEFLAKKMAEIEISPEIDELVDWLRLTPEEAADERTRWILGLDRK
jgi:predicted HAD superfamily Cof-like phosphohydrolase